MTTLVLGTIHLLVGEKEPIMSQSMQDREISPSGYEFQPGTQQASSLVEIPTQRVRFPYPAWALMMDSYNQLEIVFVKHYTPNPMLASKDNTR